MGKMKDWIINTIREDDDDYEYDENGHVIPEEDITLESLIDEFFEEFDNRLAKVRDKIKYRSKNKDSKNLKENKIYSDSDKIIKFDSGKNL